MRIQSYDKGRITVDGKTYTSDVIIYPDRIDASWWRKVGHFLQMDDLREVIAEFPEVVIIGTGYSGVMRISPEVARLLELKGIEVYAVRTTEAPALFNNFCDRKKTIACLHLTC
jgi:hypothetical protein